MAPANNLKDCQFYDQLFLHQVSLVDFYNEEARNNQPHTQRLIQSRKLHIDDSDLIAVESHDSLSLDTEDHQLINISSPEKRARNILDLQEEEIEVPDTVTELEDQIAMESVNQHLKKFGLFGRKERDGSNLVRKLTSVQPAPIGKQSYHLYQISVFVFLVFHGSTTITPEILIKHRVRYRF